MLLLSSLALLFGVPVCVSDGCPMNASQRAVCRAMGLDCCQAKGGAVSHSSPPAPALAAALAPGTPTLAGQDQASRNAGSSLPDAAPAVLQGVGLFTLLAVFRI